MEIEERFYEEAGQEIALGTRREGLWLRAFSEAEGEDARAQALYLKWRAAELQQAAIECRKAASSPTASSWVIAQEPILDFLRADRWESSSEILLLIGERLAWSPVTVQPSSIPRGARAAATIQEGEDHWRVFSQAPSGVQSIVWNILHGKALETSRWTELLGDAQPLIDADRLASLREFKS